MLRGLAGLLELIARLPPGKLRLAGHLPAQGKAELCHLGVAGEIHIRPVLVRRLMIPVSHVVTLFFFAPGQVMALEQGPLVHTECRHANSRQTEVIRAVVVASFRMIIPLDGHVEAVCQPLDRGTQRRPFRSAYYNLLRIPDYFHVLLLQTNGNVPRGTPPTL